jgi:hypothetical protein
MIFTEKCSRISDHALAKSIGGFMRTLLTAIGISVAVTFAAPVAKADETHLAGSSIRGLFPGYYKAEVQGGYTLFISAKTGGRLDGMAFGREDKGKWTIVGDQLCVSWKRWTKGQTKCGEIVRSGAWYIARSRKEGQLLRFTAIAADKFSQQVASASEINRN